MEPDQLPSMLQASVGCGCPVTVMCSERVSKARALFNRSVWTYLSP